ncbi:MAG: hypothetical protein ABIS21_02310 [Acidimicrobiales bacterium]
MPMRGRSLTAPGPAQAHVVGAHHPTSPLPGMAPVSSAGPGAACGGQHGLGEEVPAAGIEGGGQGQYRGRRARTTRRLGRRRDV